MKEHTEGPSSPPLYLPTRPQDVLLNEPDSVLLSSRFRPEQRARISRDLDQENVILSRYIEKEELGFLFKNIHESARKTKLHSVDGDSFPPPTDDSDVKADSSYQAQSSTRKERLSWL